MTLPLPINRSYWRDFSEEQLDSFSEEVFAHYRKAGFPYHQRTVSEQRQDLKTMDDFFLKKELIKKDGIIHQTMHCLGTAWVYFPHSWTIRCGAKNTPMEVFNNDVLLRKVIRKQLKMYSSIGDVSLRSRLRNFSGTQSVSNFRPSAARAIYDKYLIGTENIVWDMSCGFGGRLIGALSSPKVATYIGTEPCLETYNGLLEMGRNLNEIEPSYFENLWDDGDLVEEKLLKAIEIHRVGSECFLPPPESLDLCFTSPPYFDTEKYDTDEMQSYIKFPTRELWLDKFLLQTVENCLHGLKPKSYLIINIANVKTYKTVESDFLEKMKNFPVVYKETLNLQLGMLGTEFKQEPVFVFQK